MYINGFSQSLFFGPKVQESQSSDQNEYESCETTNIAALWLPCNRTTVQPYNP